MDNALIKLKRLLNSIDDEELENMNLWIDNTTTVDIIALDWNSISLITDEHQVTINGKEW